MEEIDSLNSDDRHYIRRKADLDDRLYKVMNDVEKRQLMESLVSEIQIFEDRQLNGQ